MKIKRPFALKTDKISSDEIKKCAVDFKKTENTASEIAKMFVNYGKMAKECKQLLKEADKILSECGKNTKDEKFLEAINKCDEKVIELNKYYNDSIEKKIDEMFE